ncbi:HI1506-related protein [Candidatus Williamhamiltonella defendens]|uniref:HI1506-related protein n=1 Tax=Candidatus Williamhamiltonella defendens TaxID=138072 RepID=UPI0020C60B9C|nr:hypothetical protein [Candidatus Hamiltonella defensa]
MNQRLFIRSKNRQGFRRADELFTSEGKMIERSNFTESQWAQIKAEPLLTIPPANGLKTSWKPSASLTQTKSPP